ncbi:MAG: A24 family peptidase [Janthinobacterium lividum]
MTQNVSSFPALFDLLLIAGLLVYASLHDLGARTIPNWTSAVIAVAGLVLRLQQHDLLAGLAAGIGTFIAAAICWRRGWMGGGDVKLFGAAALVVAPHLVFFFVTLVAFAGGALAVLYLLLGRLIGRPHRSQPRHLPLRLLRAERWRIHRHGPLPYGVAISAGCLLTLIRT